MFLCFYYICSSELLLSRVSLKSNILGFTSQTTQADFSRKIGGHIISISHILPRCQPNPSHSFIHPYHPYRPILQIKVFTPSIHIQYVLIPLLPSQLQRRKTKLPSNHLCTAREIKRQVDHSNFTSLLHGHLPPNPRDDR